MNKSIFIRGELIEKLKVTEKELVEWESVKLIVPSGYTDENTPCYSEETVVRIQHILRLRETGYNLDEIQKIIRKIGLPKDLEQEKKKKSMGQYLTVGNLAEKVGVSPRTIKHWEDKGIIEPDMRSEGGFRLYSNVYIYLCQLIMDLQHFGYTLEQIKDISDQFREFIRIREERETVSPAKIRKRLDAMLDEIDLLSEKMKLLKEGIQRWDELLKKKKKEVQTLRNLRKKKGKNEEHHEKS